MFVIELTYKAPLTEIDAYMAAHVAFLKKYYAPATSWSRAEKYREKRDQSWPSAKVVGTSKPSSRKTRFVSTASPNFGIESRASQRADDIQKRIERYCTRFTFRAVASGSLSSEVSVR